MRSENPSYPWRALSRRILERCQRDPIFFCTEVLGGERPWDRQAEILCALRDSPRVAVRSGHGVGKTWTAARAALWFLYSHPHSIVLTTAPTHRQVRSILWAEIRRQVAASRIPLGGALTETRLSLADDWFALGLSTDEPERFQGYHAEHLLLVFDEAPGVPEPIYEAARGVLTSRHARVLLIGNPTRPSGPYYDAFRHPGWTAIHVRCTDCPNVTAGRVLYPKLVTREWIDAQREEWGEDSPAYRARVLGEFPDEAESSLIPLAWLHDAQERHAPPVCPDTLALGVDVARYGTDLTVLALVDCHALREIHAFSGFSTMQTASRVLALAASSGVPLSRIAVDDTGVGGGVTDALRAQNAAVQGLNMATSSHGRAFANFRAEIFWGLRSSLAPDAPLPLALPRHNVHRLIQELSAMRYTFTPSGQIIIESKNELRSRLHASPDYADALALALAARSMGPSALRAWQV